MQQPAGRAGFAGGGRLAKCTVVDTTPQEFEGSLAELRTRMEQQVTKLACCTSLKIFTRLKEEEEEHMESRRAIPL